MLLPVTLGQVRRDRVFCGKGGKARKKGREVDGKLKQGNPGSNAGVPQRVSDLRDP